MERALRLGSGQAGRDRLAIRREPASVADLSYGDRKSKNEAGKQHRTGGILRSRAVFVKYRGEPRVVALVARRRKWGTSASSGSKRMSASAPPAPSPLCS